MEIRNGPGEDGAGSVFFGESLCLPVRVYILSLIALGIPLTLYCLAEVLQAGNWNWAYLAGMAVLTSCFVIRIQLGSVAGTSLSISASDFCIFAALLFCGPSAAALIGATEGIVSSWRVGVKHLYKCLFNAAQLALVAFIVGQVFYRLGDENIPLRPSQTFGLTGLLAKVLVCALLYFVLNSGLVAVALSLVTRQRLASVWKRNLLWASPTNFINASTAAVLFFSFQPTNSWMALVLVPLIVGIYYVYKVGLSRQADHEAGAAIDSRLTDSTQGPTLQNPLPRQAKGYLVAVILGALPVVISCLLHSFQRVESGWLYLVGLTILATCFPVRIGLFKNRMWITLSDIFVFSAMFHFGPHVAVLVALVEGLTFNLRLKVSDFYRQLFNLAQVAVVAYLIAHLLELLRKKANLLPPEQLGRGVAILAAGLACGALYFLFTSGFVAGAVALSRKQRLVPLWKQTLVWTPLTLTAAALGSTIYLYFN